MDVDLFYKRLTSLAKVIIDYFDTSPKLFSDEALRIMQDPELRKELLDAIERERDGIEDPKDAKVSVERIGESLQSEVKQPAE